MRIHKKTMKILFISCLAVLFHYSAMADDGHRLWLKYDRIAEGQILKAYKNTFQAQHVIGRFPGSQEIKNELSRAFEGLLGIQVPQSKELNQNMLLVARVGDLPAEIREEVDLKGRVIGEEGFFIKTLSFGKSRLIIVTANHGNGLLYGVFQLISLLQRTRSVASLDMISTPRIKRRILNHWDNLNRTVERGYAGFSLWDWHKLPDYIHPYYRDYARANASIGINGTVLNSVNADPLILTPHYLRKVAALADIFRPYGLKVYLSVRFSAPIDIGGLKSADPLDDQVRNWWKQKAEEIYKLIPDFGGFLVKANSEGQPGPGDYGRSHAEGANMLADALKPHGGIVMWRAFVYSAMDKEDRAKQAYNEFKPLDGKFHDNVLVQVKNGPIDFQPREPFHPLFGAMRETPLMLEFQITQEYLGFSTHLVYLGTLFKEVLESDTYVRGKGSTVAKIIDGDLFEQQLSGIAGVANTGTDRNWTGHLFGQANWYVFGRLAWDHQLPAERIAEEWITMTLSHNKETVEAIKKIMMQSREAAVNYMTPLGLHHIMGWNHHYGPAPWIKNKHRADWTSVYYHKADSLGIGFERTAAGSNALSQYAGPVRDRFSSLETCPDNYLLWFHHLPWDYTMKSGRILWDELCYHYYQGVEQVKQMIAVWNSLQDEIDPDIFTHVKQMLAIQEKEAEWWRNACVLYFRTFSHRPVPEDLEKPGKTLQYYQQLSFPYAPK